MQSMMADLGVTTHVRVWTDSNAAKAIASRRGVGKTRHARRKRDPQTSTRQLHDHDHDHLHDTTTRVGALVIHHPGWIITPVGPGKDTHGTLGPLRREAVGGPTTRPKGEASDNDAPHEHHKREVFRQTRHVEWRYLWLQEVTKLGRVKMRRIWQTICRSGRRGIRSKC